MFKINKDDQTISVTRGDVVLLDISAESEDGIPYVFKSGDVVRISIYGKKSCDEVVLKKDVLISADTEAVPVLLTGDDTRIGEVISKPVDYWYDVELNPDTYPQTIIGYDESGPRVFRLYPEGSEI